MDITPVVPNDRKIIKSYGEKSFKVNDENIEGSIVIMPDNVENWQPRGYEEIDLDSFGFIDENSNIEILLVGCGEEHKQVPHELHIHFAKMGIGVEFMTTGAACRTYNVLLSEERQVVAALIAV